MPINFTPNFKLTPNILNLLISIESVKERIIHLPITPTILTTLRETAKLYTTHFSTMIEGNQLEPAQIETVIKFDGHFPGREREENEVLGYYAALNQVEKYAASNTRITEKLIKTLHSLVMSNGKTKISPTEYRDGQNVIRDGRTKSIIYMPPEANDVPTLMKDLVEWINTSDLPCPIIAAISHYQFATIHPYYDGNGRTARLLTTLILHLGGYDLKGLYSLEEYYARNLGAYYEAISIGESHNYYFGRAEADITKWVEYFIEGMEASFKKVLKHMQDAKIQNLPDNSHLLKKLDPRQRKILSLFQEYEIISSSQIGELFGFKPRTSSKICLDWVQSGFLEIVGSSKKNRKYKLASEFSELL